MSIILSVRHTRWDLGFTKMKFRRKRKLDLQEIQNKATALEKWAEKLIKTLENCTDYIGSKFQFCPVQ